MAPERAKRLQNVKSGLYGSRTCESAPGNVKSGLCECDALYLGFSGPAKKERERERERYSE